MIRKHVLWLLVPLLGCATSKPAPVERDAPEVRAQVATPTKRVDSELVADDTGANRFSMLSLDRDLDAGIANTLRSSNDFIECSCVVRTGVQIRR
ncbi:MAG: hypothetical protein K8S98_02320 [Planctomycetes bacterium]|nr:hypothetical protein [Planctomycetota bacterium]